MAALEAALTLTSAAPIEIPMKEEPFPLPVATVFVVGFFQPRQLLHILSGSELQVQIESSSKRSESSKLKHSSLPPSAAAATTTAPPPCASLLFHS